MIGIWRYTYQEWGEQQADKYLDEIDAGITQLQDHPRLGRDRSEVRHGYRSLRINEHVIFYTVAGDLIRIVRVPHARMHNLNRGRSHSGLPMTRLESNPQGHTAVYPYLLGEPRYSAVAKPGARTSVERTNRPHADGCTILYR